MQIKTLAEILAESDTDSASSAVSKSKLRNKSKSSKPTQTELFNRRKSKKAQRFNQDSNSNTNTNTDIYSDNRSDSYSNESATDHSNSDFYSDDYSEVKTSKPIKSKSKAKKGKKRFHPAATFVADFSGTPAYVPPESQSIKQMLAEVKRNVHQNQSYNSLKELTGSDAENHQNSNSQSDEITSNDSAANDYIDNLTAKEIDNLPSALKAYLRSPEQKQAEIDAIKAESRLRWLAFYYLSRREHGKAELKQKLIDKEQDPLKIDELLTEFEEKGYQSDYRTTLMLIRENIRKGRGRSRIMQEFYKKKIAMPSNLDELIDMANSESEEFSEFVDDNEDSLVEGIDWLKLAVEARTKKYGNDIPLEQKDKAKQLRFLQYRGFKANICFQALSYNLQNLDERF